MAEKFPQGAAPQENKMGVLPIGRLLTNMAVPMMISMLVQACYNVVDSVFVAQISEDALNAVSLAFPLQNLMIAFGAGTAVGINALLSRSLGEKNQAMADRAANTGIFLSLCSFVVFALVGIFLSHELSGTCQCARLAADMANVDNVLFVDSESVCLGESLLVRLAVQLRDAGKTAGQIAATLEHAKEHLHLVAVIDDLKYLRKGGRLPAAVAVAGGMLGIKPLITIKEGKVAMAGKARGLPGAYVALFKKIEELGGVNPRFPSLAGYTISPREVNPIQTYLVDNLGLPEPLVRQIGCVIGTHAGPGAFGLAFFDNGLVID